MLCQQYPEWVEFAIGAVLLACGCLAVYVGWKADADKSIKRIDSARLRRFRTFCFMAVALFAFALVMTHLSAYVFLLLLIATASLLSVDAVGLTHRPGDNGHKVTFGSEVRSAGQQLAALFRRRRE